MSSDCTGGFVRTMENFPIIGHLIAMCHSCTKKTAHAERAALKSTIGICFCICNFPTEAFDECTRYKSVKLHSHSLTTRPEWMRKYHHYTLRQICLPGSHQSTTYHVHKKLRAIPMATGWTQCQDLTLSAQLRGGIRFLDLRVMTLEEDGEIWTHHNVVVCVPLKEILETVRQYVVDHPSEIVGLAFASDNKPIDWSVCASLLNEYVGDKMIHEHMRDMLIGDIVDQGKNIFIYGVPNVAFSWRGINSYWPNKEWVSELRANMESVMADQNKSESTNLFWYKGECTPGKYMIARGVGGVPGASVAQCSEEKLEFVEEMAASVNNVVLDILYKTEEMNFNVLSTDFVQDEVVDRIIELNKKTAQHDETFALSSENQALLSEVSHDNILRTAAALDVTEVMAHEESSFLSQTDGNYSDRSLSVSFSKNGSRKERASSRPLLAQTKSQRASSVRSSASTLAHNTTALSGASSQFEMPSRKAPPLEVKETTM